MSDERQADMLGFGGEPLTLADAQREVQREITTRERVYPGWIQSGKIDRRVADHRLRAMKLVGAILLRIQHTGEIQIEEIDQ